MIEKSQLIAKNEGIIIPRTIDEYTKRLPIIPSVNEQDDLFDDDDETEDDDRTLDENPSFHAHSQSNSRIKLITNSEMKIAMKSAIDRSKYS